MTDPDASSPASSSLPASSPSSPSVPGTVDGCVFCGIVRREIPAEVVFDGDNAMAFLDLQPKAPVHVLVIPKVHVVDLAELSGSPDQAGQFVVAIVDTAKALGLRSYRTIFNTGADAGQTVFHVHAHLLSGAEQSLGFERT